MNRLPFLEVFIDRTGGNTKLQTSDYQKSGTLPIIDQGREPIAGFTDQKDAVADVELPAIVFGDHTRVIKYVDHPFVLGADGTKVLSPRKDGYARFLFHYLRSIEIPSAGYSRHFKFLKEITVPFPALDEQRRIAAILDKADELRTKRRQAIAHLDALTQSIFHSMFSDPNWSRTTLREASLRFVGGRNLVGSGTNIHTANKVLKVNAVSSGSFDQLQTKPLPADYSPPLDHQVRVGDLIVTRASGTKDLIGVATPVVRVQNDTYLPDKLWRVEMDTKIIVPTFFRFLTKAPAYREYVANAASGAAGVSNISQTKLLTFEFGLPPLDLQETFSTRVAAVERLKETHRKHLAELDALFASLQHRAFKGEL